MGRQLIDISQPVGSDAGIFPGDTPFQYEWSWDMADGAACNVARVTTTPHAGTHADAPLHFDSEGVDISRVSLEAYVGLCTVIDVMGDAPIHPAVLEDVDFERTPRVLLRTHDHQDTKFRPGFAALTEECAEYLNKRSAMLVGLDTPSMDAHDAKLLKSHHALGRGGIAILENLVLWHVEPGEYELIALPVRWVGLDAAPVRAVLRSLS